MNQVEAIAQAREFVLKNTGVDAEPASSRLVQRPGTPSFWTIVYAAELFFPEDAAKGATFDGPYVIRVDDATGDVSVLG